MQYDLALCSCWADLADRTLPETAKIRLGISGVQLASSWCHAAYWASWTSCIESVREELGFASVTDCLEALPVLTAKLENARQGLSQQGLVLSQGAELPDALRQAYPQRLLVGHVQKKIVTGLHQSLDRARSAELRGAGGPGAAGFLQYPSDASCAMEDVFWSAALRQRLGLPRAELSQGQLSNSSSQCCCRNRQGQVCGQPLDPNGFHALTEQSGGGVLARHRRVAKAVGGLVARWRQTTPLFEQRVPGWDRPRQRPQPGQDPIERAILDVEFATGQGRRWIDVTVRHPAAGSQSAIQACSRRNGEPSRRAEKEKHERYPGDQLTAFAVETPGRIGLEARTWLLNEVRCLPTDIQMAELTRAYKVISCALQVETVRQLRRAAGLR